MSSPIVQFPTRQKSRKIVEEFCEERESHTDIGHNEVTITGRIPMVVTDENISLDRQKINEMGLTHHAEHRSLKHDWDRIIKPIRMTAKYAVTEYVSEWIHDRSREMAIDSLADMIEETCRKGFIKEPIYGERYEPKQPERDVALSAYIDDGSEMPDDLDQTFETVRREYQCGTIRYSVDGVVYNRVWWDDHVDDSTRWDRSWMTDG